MKVVLDTNVLLSGLMLPGSIPGKIVGAWLGAQYDLVVSEALLDEIARTLAYPKINKRLRWETDEINTFIMLLRLKCEMVSLKGIRARIPSDPHDEHLLKLLIASEAEYLVSGDSDLLALAKKHPIVTPAEFAALL